MTTQPRLYLVCRQRRGHTVITAAGTIAKTTVIQLRTVLLQRLARHERSLFLDLAGVDYIDDAGLDALRRTAVRAHLLGGQLRLVAASPAVAARLRTSDLRSHLAVDTALSSPGSELSLDADTADLIDRHVPVPVDEEDYPANT